ncbi:hypothetical protein Baya_16275 [Bagarius yarrelli]|uniref:Uncharacterized protein n=1 Tax=Bagarius yarrelli TaxID=175774 RepID=A0A556VUV5_BAGYA|nr:hypothetical protein Baya_16275 [Bagarius yarrelli]
MKEKWTDDIRELITALTEKFNLIVRNSNLMTGLGIGATSAGLGVFLGPVGVLAGIKQTITTQISCCIQQTNKQKPFLMVFSGAALGGVVSVWMNGERSLIEVIKDLSTDALLRLYTGVKERLDGWVWPCPDALLEKVFSSESLQKNITDFLERFFKTLHMVVVPKM